MDIDPQLRELQLIFIDEAKQFLDDAEETLMAIESTGTTAELVNKAFRLAHNFKGSARSVGYTAMANLAHKYEDILSDIKKGSYPLTPNLISALLHCNDTLRNELLATQQDPSHEPNIESEIEALALASQNRDIKPEQQHPETDWSKGFEIFEDTPPLKAEPTILTKMATKTKTQAAPTQAKTAVDDTLKVPTLRLDQVLNIVGEMVVNQTILDGCRNSGAFTSDTASQAVAYMSKLVNDLHDISNSLRLVPIRPLFQKLRRTARDIASTIEKDFTFLDEGDYCEIDKSVIDRIADPLNHMIRNAVDHGVDTPEERKNAGKPLLAKITLTAITLDDQVKITLSDDGRGLNKDKILAKAVSNGLIQKGAALSDDEIYALIFAAGFSTKEQVTDVSGRGVGMEVVQRAVDDLKGSIKIYSVLGKGTTFEITLPLSLSIIGGMVVQANGQRFVIPVSQLVETIEMGKFKTESITGASRGLILRGEILPIYHLSDLLGRGMSRKKLKNQASDSTVAGAGITPSEAMIRPALVAMYRGKKITFEVEEIINQQKIVLKKLGPEFEGIPGIVAGAILSNGEPGLVLSLDSLIAGVAA